MLLNFVVLLILNDCCCIYRGWENKSDHYSLYEITAFNVRERSVLYKMHVSNDTVMFLNGVTNIVSSPMFVVIDDICKDAFEETLDDENIEYIQVNKDSV